MSDVVCAGPEDMKGKRLNDMTSLQNECVSTGEKQLFPDQGTRESNSKECEDVYLFVYKKFMMHLHRFRPSSVCCLRIFVYRHVQL